MEYKRLTFRYESVDGTKVVGYTEKLIPCFNKQAMILNRLAELEDKIELGTLIELPCKVGDKVYIDERCFRHTVYYNHIIVGSVFFAVGRVTSIRITKKQIF